MELYELDARYDARQSFYHKAMVQVEGDTKTLLSYETRVAEIKEIDGKPKVTYADFTYSQTTNRHIREFIHQLAPKDFYDLGFNTQKVNGKVFEGPKFPEPEREDPEDFER